MKQELRKLGIDVIGNVPWGTHFALFYKTKQDLLDALLPYFDAGLKNNEFCMWVTAEPLNAEEAKAYMAEALPDFNMYVERGQIEIIPYTEWYQIDGVFDPDRVLNGWVEKLRKAQERGFSGLRLTGNESWLDMSLWGDFIDYERTINGIIGQYDMLGMCSYPQDKWDANDILDVLATHQFVLTRRNGLWKIIEDQEQKKARNALQESEDKFKAIFDRAAMGLAIADQNGYVIDCNLAYQEILGYGKDELQEKRFAELTHPEDIERNLELQRKMADGLIDKYQIEKRYIRKDGRLIWCKVIASAIRNQDGSLKNNMSVVEDITERKQVEEERETTVMFLKLVSESRSTRELIQAAAMFFQQRSGCEAVGLRLREGDDYPYYEARGFRPEFVRKENLLCNRDADGRVIHDSEGFPVLDCMCGNVITGRFDPLKPFFTARGSFWTNSTTELLATTTERDRLARTRNVCNTEGYESFALIALHVGDERLGVLQLNDRRKGHFTHDQITMWEMLADYLAVALAKFGAEEALKDAKAQAELYLDLMGHDINNMHQIALGYLEMAQDIQADDGQKEFITRSMEVLQRSTRLIKNVRKLQKLQDGLLQANIVDVDKILADVQREYGSMPNKNITLNTNGCQHCTVRANDLLHDVFSNLITNAIKHTGDHADINISLDWVAENGCKYFRVMVEDNGPGIPDNAKDAIFYRTLKGTSKAKGMGIGLYLVKSLVDSYNGKVWAEDRVPGDHTKGAKFVIILPEAE